MTMWRAHFHVLCTVFAAAALQAADSRRPNVLLLVSDNQPADTIRALGNTYIETPHLDRLVREGSAFTRAITANPHCIPSRAEIMTGTTGFVNRSSPFGRRLNPNVPHWAEVMRAAGYHTWYSGKWHTEGTPWNRGYEETRGLFSGGSAKSALPQTYPRMRNGRPATGYLGSTFKTNENQPELDKGVGLTPQTDQHIASAAIELIQRRPAKPFFLHVNFTACHDPLLPPPGFEGKYDSAAMPLPPNFMPAHPFDWGNAQGRDELLLETPLKPEDVRRELADLYAVISHLDFQIGRVLQALEETDQEKSTLVIFITDNGAGVGRHGIRGYQNMYEHALTVPLILRGPGIPRDARFATQTYLRDLFPTVCELAGVNIPNTVEGRSLVPVLAGRTREIHPEVYAYWHRDGMTGDLPIERMVRTDRWKLIQYTHLGRHQLFDLQNDPWELRDLSADPRHAVTRTELQAKLDGWFAPRIARWKAEAER